MKRLTHRDEYGNADIIGVDSADLQLNLDFKALNRVTEALNRLADYEEKTELLPEEIAAKMKDAPPCPDDCLWRKLGRYHKCTSCARSRSRPDNYITGAIDTDA